MNITNLMRRLQCPAGKRCFETAEKAARFRQKNKRKNDSERSIRAYHCECGWWHNTSMTLAAYTALESRRETETP